MATEVCRQAYVFKPGSAPPPNMGKLLSKKYPLLDGDDELDLQPGDEDEPQATAEELAARIKSPFHQSPLHDLESLWWLTGYVTFEYSSKLLCKILQFKDAKGKVHGSARSFFPKELFEDDHQRYLLMTNKGYFAQYAYILPKSLRPAGAALERFRRELVARYEETEKSEDAVKTPAFDGLHQMLAETMRTIADVIAKAEQEQQTPALQSKKKRRDAERDEPTAASPEDTKRPRVS